MVLRRAVIRLGGRVLGSAAHLPGMNSDARNLRLRVTRRDEPDLARLVEWVLGIAEARHRAWVNGEPDPYGLALPDGIGPESSRSPDGSGKFPGPSAPEGDRTPRHHGGGHFPPPSSDATSTR